MAEIGNVGGYVSGEDAANKMDFACTSNPDVLQSQCFQRAFRILSNLILLMPSLLICEPQPEIARVLQESLQEEGFEVHITGFISNARTVIDRSDLLVTELFLQDGSGLDFIRDLRHLGYDLPIIVATYIGVEQTKATALYIGADDYVTKPYGLLEVSARIRAQLRRYAGTVASTAEEQLRIGHTVVNLAARTVTRGDKVKHLTPKEFSLLRALVGAKNSVVQKHDLLSRVWGFKSAARTRTLDWHISQLRQKIELDPKHPIHIRTVARVGYMLQI